MHGRHPIKEAQTKSPSVARRGATWLVVLLALAGVGYYFLAGGADVARRNPRSFTPQGPVPVVAVPAKRADVPVYLDAVGTVRALNTVTVRAQVDGKLLSVNFKEGDDVKKGVVLAQIDPTTFQAALDQAVAKKAQ